MCFVVALGVVLLSSRLALTADAYTQVGSTLDLAVGTRSRALGGATVGVPDCGASVFCNPAWLGWAEERSAVSCVGIRPNIAGWGHVALATTGIGIGMHYFDFGSIPQTDEFGNTTGEFSYRAVGLVAATSVVLGDLPELQDSFVAECVGFGVSFKMLKVNTVDPGDGLGFAVDASFLLHADPPPFLQPTLNCLSFGMVAENRLGAPIRYDTGHSERWDRQLSIGGSVELAEQWLLAVDLAGNGNVHIGLEWMPLAAFAFRVGAQHVGTWILSLGCGMHLKELTLDLAFCTHPFLSGEVSGSLGYCW